MVLLCRQSMLLKSGLIPVLATRRANLLFRQDLAVWRPQEVRPVWNQVLWEVNFTNLTWIEIDEPICERASPFETA